MNADVKEIFVSNYSRNRFQPVTSDDYHNSGHLHNTALDVPSSPPAQFSSSPSVTNSEKTQPEDWVTLNDSKTSAFPGDDVTDKQLNDSITTASMATSLNSAEPSTERGSLATMAIYLHNDVVTLLEVEDVASANSETLFRSILNCDEIGITNRSVCNQVFGLWIKSPILELQLKSSHKPFDVNSSWGKLVKNYSHASHLRQTTDEPCVYFQRSVYCSQQVEESIKDWKIIELLYHEAKWNILNGRYPCSQTYCVMLGAIQARLELGAYDNQVHTTQFFREKHSKYLPVYERKNSTRSLLPISGKNSPEVRLLEQFKRIPSSANNRRLMRKYLELCWLLPFYGAAFFEGQIEQPVRGLFSLLTQQDVPVLVAINSKGIYVIDDAHSTFLLGLRYEEFNWEYAKPSNEQDPDCLACIFIQFSVMEGGRPVSKILQIFSRQAVFIDILITTFVQQMCRTPPSAVHNDEVDKSANANFSVPNSPSEMDSNLTSDAYTLTVAGNGASLLTNNLDQLTLATFDENGQCIEQMGSWQFST